LDHLIFVWLVRRMHSLARISTRRQCKISFDSALTRPISDISWPPTNTYLSLLDQEGDFLGKPKARREEELAGPQGRGPPWTALQSRNRSVRRLRKRDRRTPGSNCFWALFLTSEKEKGNA
jgi:hypothetical protein